jgi:hypothetical protein
MNNQGIKQKYGIEPIMKEMWVWNIAEENATKRLVLFFHGTEKRYFTLDFEDNFMYFPNASETNPNEKEIKVGDKGYFWNDENEFVFSKLRDIDTSDLLPYLCNLNAWFKYFSHEKQPWMK